MRKKLAKKLSTIEMGHQLHYCSATLELVKWGTGRTKN